MTIRITDIALVGAVMVCCGLPFLAASGLVGVMLGIWLRWWPVGVGAILIGGVAAFLWWRRARACRKSPNHP